MEDAVANYESTKRNAPVPPGWMLVEPNDPACKPTETKVVFWNSASQTWEDLAVTADGAPEAFNKLWVGGATCLAVRDPNYVAPPPPVVQAPAMGGLPFAAPAPMQMPFAAPVPPTAPAPVQVAPVIPVVAPAPVIPVVQPVPAPVIPVVVPVAQPIVPQVQPERVVLDASASLGKTYISTPLPAGFVAEPEPTFPKAENEVLSEADPNEVSAWLAAYKGVTDQINALEAVKNELRKKIVNTCFPNGLVEGAGNKCVLPDGRKLTITGVVNRTVDAALVPSVLEALQVKNGVAPVGLFKQTYKLDLRVFRGINKDDKMILSNAITEKQGSPQLKVSDAE